MPSLGRGGTMRGPTAFWRALERARRENLRDAGEAMPIAGSDGQTRRQVLLALAATAATAALLRPARVLAVVGGVVVIIGGGIGGLAALWHLTQAGIDARLYEARTRLGGRMYTAKAKGQPAIEVGGQLVNTDHADMHELCREFGVSLIDRKGGPLRTMILDGGREVSESQLVAGLRGIAGQIDSDSVRLDQNYARVAAELDRMSFTGYLDKYAKLMPDRWVRVLMEATARTEYGVEPGQASAIELVFNLPAIDGRRIDVLSRSDERYLMAGGSSSLIEAMTARLASKITTFRRATRIAPMGSGARVQRADVAHRRQRCECRLQGRSARAGAALRQAGGKRGQGHDDRDGDHRAANHLASRSVLDGRLRQFPPGPADQVRRADLDRDRRRRVAPAFGGAGAFRGRASVGRLNRVHERRRADRAAGGAIGYRRPRAGAANGLSRSAPIPNPDTNTHHRAPEPKA